MKNLIIIIIIAFVFSSCKQIEPVYILPDGNIDKGIKEGVDSVNSKFNDFAPNKIPTTNKEYPNPYELEFLDNSNPNIGITSSRKLIRSKMGLENINERLVEFMTNNHESVSFINNRTGVISLSHLPNKALAKQRKLVYDSHTGGTDLYEFNYNNSFESIEFSEIKELNSPFWESHPFVADTTVQGQNISIIFFASDRDKPYYNVKDSSGTVIDSGSTNIYYAFKVNDSWADPQILETGVSTAANEVSPFIYCLCYNPTLLFASDRKDGKKNFDIYYTKLSINFDFDDLTKSTIDVVDEVKMFNKEKKESIFFNSVNSYFDDKFPFIPNPIKNPDNRYLYFSSDRFSKSVNISPDTILASKGGADIYKYKLKSKDFECIPPPPPIAKLVTHVNMINVALDGTRDTIYDIDTDVLVKTGGFELGYIPTKQAIEVDFGKLYRISKKDNIQDCEKTKYDSSFKQIPSWTNKPEIIVHDTIYSITTYTPYSYVNEKISQGIAFFITGYWHPLTIENLNEFKRKQEQNALVKSKFIDPDDYDFYEKAAELNTEWFNNFYQQIDSVLMALPECHDLQKVVITTHGFTDPIRLRPTMNNDSTKYTSDYTFNFEDITIPDGMDMKYPNLKSETGTEVNWKFGSQQGNRSLSLLRSYFTKETIDKNLKARYKNRPELLEKYKRYVRYYVDYFGIYNNKDEEGNYIETGKCPGLDDVLVGKNELKNIPSNGEKNNFPYSRRVMIYMDVITNELFEEGNFKRNICGDNYLIDGRKKRNQKLQDKIAKEQALIATKAEEEFLIDSSKNVEIPNIAFNTETCTGPCYFIRFSVVSNPEERDELIDLINYIKTSSNEQFENSFKIIGKSINGDKIQVVTTIFSEKESAEKVKEYFEESFKYKFRKIVDTGSIKLKFEIVQKDLNNY